MLPFFNITKEDLLLLNYIKYEAQRQALLGITQTQSSSTTQSQSILPQNLSLPLPQVPLNINEPPFLLTEPKETEEVVATKPSEQPLSLQSRKRSHSETQLNKQETEILDEANAAHLSEVQKEKKSKREKKRRKNVRELYLEVAYIVSSLNLVQKPPQKLQRLEILSSLVCLLGVPANVEEFKRELATHTLLKSQPELTAKKLKSMNEKRRRDKLRFVIDTAGELVNCAKGSDQADVLIALLNRLRLGGLNHP